MEPRDKLEIACMNSLGFATLNTTVHLSDAKHIASQREGLHDAPRRRHYQSPSDIKLWLFLEDKR